MLKITEYKTIITLALSEYVLSKYHISTNRILRIYLAKCLNRKQLMSSKVCRLKIWKLQELERFERIFGFRAQLSKKLRLFSSSFIPQNVSDLLKTATELFHVN